MHFCLPRYFRQVPALPSLPDPDDVTLTTYLEAYMAANIRGRMNYVSALNVPRT